MVKLIFFWKSRNGEIIYFIFFEVVIYKYAEELRLKLQNNEGSGTRRIEINQASASRESTLTLGSARVALVWTGTDFPQITKILYALCLWAQSLFSQSQNTSKT